MNTIEKTVSAEPITGFTRVARHENFVILANLEMVQQVRVITLDAATGKPLADLIAASKELSDEQKQAIGQRYTDQVVTRQTAGAFVNAQGQVVEPETKGAISQRDYFQAITIGDLKKMGMPITDKTSVISLIYAMMENEISNIDARGQL